MIKDIQHIGFIMDGNRTWAKERGLPSLEGHRRGYENAKKIIGLISKTEIPFMSLWALSDDNIKNRSPEEVSYLFRLLAKGILDIAKEAKKEGNRIIIVGDRSLLPESCQSNILRAESLTKDGIGMTILIAIGYGGQEEIIRAVRSYIAHEERTMDVTRERFQKYIETNPYPSPDLIIRTGGHMRHSGFFLFVSPYAEYFFSEKNWPDFDEKELQKAIKDFQMRDRKFGK